MPQAKELVRARNAQFENFFHENKMTELADTYASDGKLMPAGHTIIVGRQAIKDFFQNERKGADGVKIIEEEVVELGNDTILDRGKYEFLNGKELLDEGKYVVIHKKVDGKCQAYIDIFNTDRS